MYNSYHLFFIPLIFHAIPYYIMIQQVFKLFSSYIIYVKLTLLTDIFDSYNPSFYPPSCFIIGHILIHLHKVTITIGHSIGKQQY